MSLIAVEGNIDRSSKKEGGWIGQVGLQEALYILHSWVAVAWGSQKSDTLDGRFGEDALVQG